MFILQDKPIDLNTVKIINDPSVGALVSFEGIVRSDLHKNHQVNILEYLADASACTTEGSTIIIEACANFHLTQAVCIQRIGKVPVGDSAIWIGAWATHRDDAFKGCRYIIEQVKKRLLIWKKEHFTDGHSHWVHGPETLTIG